MQTFLLQDLNFQNISLVFVVIIIKTSKVRFYMDINNG